MIQTISRNMNGADEFQKGFREFAFGYRSRTQAASRGSARVDLGHRRSPSVGAVHPPDRVCHQPEPKPGPPSPRLGRGPRDPRVARPAAGARSLRQPRQEEAPIQVHADLQARLAGELDALVGAESGWNGWTAGRWSWSIFGPRPIWRWNTSPSTAPVCFGCWPA